MLHAALIEIDGRNEVREENRCEIRGLFTTDTKYECVKVENIWNLRKVHLLLNIAQLASSCIFESITNS